MKPAECHSEPQAKNLIKSLLSVLLIILIAFVVRLAISSYDSPAYSKPYRIADAVPRTAQEHILFGVPLDINEADVVAFEALPGIGPSLASRIVKYREVHGGFRTVEEILDVPGIGPKLLARISPWLVSTN